MLMGCDSAATVPLDAAQDAGVEARAEAEVEPPELDAGSDQALDATPDSARAVDATPDRALDAGGDAGPDAAPPDAGRDAFADAEVDAAPQHPTGLHLVAADPPTVGWLRGGHLEVSTFTPQEGLSPRWRSPAPTADGRAVLLAGEIRAAWTGADGVYYEGRRILQESRLADLRVRAGVVYALTVAADLTDGTVYRLEGAPLEQSFFSPAPDASEVLGLSVTDARRVLVGDWQADRLLLLDLDAGSESVVCEAGCDRPRARIVGGAVLFQALGELHLHVEGQTRALRGAVRGSVNDLADFGGWRVAYTEPVGLPSGVYLEGVMLREGAVSELRIVGPNCAVWLAPEPGWGCAPGD